MKTLSERIAERAKAKPSATPHANRAIVLALRKDIQQALDDGWSVRAVYQTLYDEGRLTFSYQAFRRYVNQIHLGKPLPTRHRPAPPSSPVRTGTSTAATGFSFDPSPKKEDLL